MGSRFAGPQEPHGAQPRAAPTRALGGLTLPEVRARPGRSARDAAVHPSLRLFVAAPESSAELATGRLIRQMAQRGGYFSWGRVPLHMLLPQPIYGVRTQRAARVRGPGLLLTLGRQRLLL